jgi:hypothetical protein
MTVADLRSMVVCYENHAPSLRRFPEMPDQVLAPRHWRAAQRQRLRGMGAADETRELGRKTKLRGQDQPRSHERSHR